MTGSCNCGARWGGLRTCHCSRCHLTFSTVGNFDRHQRGGKCLHPSEVGLVERGWPSGNQEIWQKPSDTSYNERFHAA